jgi:lipopolysaccharide transport system ATP-binding protein
MRSEGEVLVRVEGVSKKFCKDLKTSLRYGLSDVAGQVIGRQRSKELRPKEFWAVKDVTFELRRGECLGLIGRNGAGKTSLLKMLNGLVKPDHGTITMRGRVGALIALGAGFNPILTGRENIYVNGAVLGLSKARIDERVEDIIDFAEIREFIDSPVQSYSSGMTVRLGFAIATAMDPDVLILDEVLAVGDAAFRHKCYHRINAIMKNCAVILVSHSMSQIAAVSSAVGMMRKGQFQLFPSVVEGIGAYNTENADTGSIKDEERVFTVYPPVQEAALEFFRAEVNYGDRLEMNLRLKLQLPLQNVSLSFTAVDRNEQPVMNWNSDRLAAPLDLPAGESTVRFHVDPVLLHDGAYTWNLWLSRPASIEACVYIMRGGQFSVTSTHKPISDIPYLPEPVAVVLGPSGSGYTVEGVKNTTDPILESAARDKPNSN